MREEKGNQDTIVKHPGTRKSGKVLIPLALKRQGEGTVLPEPDKSWSHGRGLQPLPDCQGREEVGTG